MSHSFFDNVTCDSTKLYEYIVANKTGQTCYIAAEIESNAVSPKGLTLELGDGTIVGGFSNTALAPNLDYSLKVAVILKLEVSIIIVCKIMQSVLKRR